MATYTAAERYALRPHQPAAVPGKNLSQCLAANWTEPRPVLTEFWPKVPTDFAVDVARRLAKDLADRFNLAVELEQALGQCGCAAEWSAERAAE